MATYSGHKNWNHWNVALWIGNDEGIYRRAMHAIRSTGSLDSAARYLMADLADSHAGTRTPDGAQYTFTAVRAALRGLK